MAEQINGQVKKSIVTHFSDCSSSTEIELEDGSVIRYSHVAPIPAGHTIRASGEVATFGESLMAFHPGIFGNEVAMNTWLGERAFTFEMVFGRTSDCRILKCAEIEDATDWITYREHR